MLTVLLLDNGEKSVVQMTYKAIWAEIKDIPGAELIVTRNWVDEIQLIDNKYTCIIESDCLVSSGYFNSLLGYIKKNAMELNKMGVFSSATAVKNWAVRFYGFNIGNDTLDKVIPNKTKKATTRPFYTVQIGYIPGAILRTKFLKQVIDVVRPLESWKKDTVFLSAQLSLGFWGKDWMVYIAPGPTYCTTEDYVNDIASFELEDITLLEKFHRESV